MSVITEEPTVATAIRPFTVEFNQADIKDLKARLAATRFPEKEPVDDSIAGRATQDGPGARALLGQ